MAKKKTTKKVSHKKVSNKGKSESEGDLTAMRELFVYNYIENGFRNGRQAAIDAGFSEKGAAVAASRFLINPKIQQQIAEKKIELEAELDKALKISKIQVLAKWAKIGLGVSQSADRDQLKATELIARHLGMFNEAGKGDNRMDNTDVASRVRETFRKMRAGRRNRGKKGD